MSLQEHKYTHLEAHSEFRGCHRDQSQIAFVYISIQMGVGGGTVSVNIEGLADSSG